MRCRKVFICLPIAIFALAQEQPKFRAGTRLVQVSVVVRDANGPVTGLTKDDFALFDKGKPRQISVFAVNGGQNAARPRALAPGEVSNRADTTSAEASSATVVLLDLLNSRWQDQVFAREQLARFIDSIGDSDRMALLALKKTLVVLQDYTTGRDRAQLSQAVQHLPFQTDEGQLPISQSIGQIMYWAMVKKEITDQALQAIVRHLGAFPGRRNLVWIASGFAYDTHDRVLVTAELTRMLTENNIALYLVGARGVIAPAAADNPSPGWRHVGNARTVAHRGGISPVPPFAGPSLMFEISRDLSHFAESTGGLGLFNDNDLRAAIAEAMQDSAVTYTLGFYPPETALDGTAHPLKVKVARKGVDVRYRQSWYASAADKVAALSTEQAIEQLVKDPLDATAIGLSAIARRVSNPVELAVDLAVNLPDLRLESEGVRRRGSIDVAYQLNGSGNVTFRTINLDLSEEEFRAEMGKPYGVSVSIPLVPGTAGQVRILVRDRASGAAGSLRLALSPQEGSQSPIECWDQLRRSLRLEVGHKTNPDLRRVTTIA
jgi:VWFA-related protein